MKTPTPKRDVRLDAIRGVFLIIMAGVHVPTPVSHLLREPFGFTSAAEGFIFLSACLAGIVYGKIYGLQGWAAMSAKVWRRARLVYVVHLSLLLVLALIAWFYAQSVTPLANHFHDVLAHPIGAFLLFPLLLHQPPLFDILPMYVLFLLATPPVFAAARRHGWMLVLMISALVWGAAQLQSVYFPTDTTRLLPLRGGSFNLLAWQFLWMAGLALGEASNRRELISRKFRMPLGVLGAIFVTTGLLLRHGMLGGWQISPDYSQNIFWLNKWTLGPLRLLNFAAWAVMLLAWNPRPPAGVLAPTALLGRHSLAVFAFHLPLVIFATTTIQMLALSNDQQIVLALGMIGLLFAWAGWLDGNTARRKLTRPHAQHQSQISNDDPAPTNAPPLQQPN